MLSSVAPEYFPGHWIATQRFYQGATRCVRALAVNTRQDKVPQLVPEYFPIQLKRTVAFAQAAGRG